MSPSKVGRHRAGNGNDFSVRRLTGGDRLVYNFVKFQECTRREAGFFVAVSRKQTECVMNDSLLLCQFRISAAMRSYVLRVRLRGTDFEFGSEPEQAVAYTKCIREMRRILVDKRRRSSNPKESRSCIRFSIGPSTLSFSQDDGGPVPDHS